ncbi:MAG TPA: VanW family protein, partial [Patescibacteria group bacterium]|nr:VanW family protein [Patescibacteria group bacterium]
VGDGVCHLASLISWAAKDAGLDVYVPARHDFAKINDVPKEYGVSINSNKPYGNLYITNNFDKPVTFNFNYDGTNLTVSVSKEVL